MAYIPVKVQSVAGTVGASVIGLPYMGIAGSVATVGTAVANQSISGTINLAPTSIAVLQGTNPFIVTGSVQAAITPSANQSVSGQVDAVIVGGSITTVGGSTGNSSVQVLNFPTNQSVSGTVNITGTPSISGAVTIVGKPSISGTVDIGIMSGSVVAFPTGNQSISGAVNIVGTPSISGAVNVNVPTPSYLGYQAAGSIMATSATQGTDPWKVNVPTPSYVAYQLAGSVMNVNISGSVAAVGTAAANQSVSGSVGIVGTPSISGAVTVVLSSIAALQGTNPWQINVPTPSLIAYQLAGSVMAVSGGSVAAWNLGGYSSVMLSSSTNASVKTLAYQAGGSLLGTAQYYGYGSVMLMASTDSSVVAKLTNSSVTALQGTNPWINLVSGSVATVFTASSVVSGHGSVNGAASVLVIPSVGAGLYTYVTDFLLSNTGAATTLVTFTDSDGSIMGKSIAPTGGGAIATSLSTPMKTYKTNADVYVGAATATSTLHAWLGAYKAS